MTADDVPQVTRIHLAAFPSFFLSSLGEGFLSYYYRQFPASPGTIAIVAQRASTGEIVGFAAGACNPRGFYRRLLFSHLAGFAIRAAMAALRRPSAIKRLLRGLTHAGSQPDGDTVVGLFSIAVDPIVQGMGVAGELLSALVRHAADRGATAVLLHTDAQNNARANSFYRKHRFEIRCVVVTPEGRQLNEYWRMIPPRQSGSQPEASTAASA